MKNIFILFLIFAANGILYAQNTADKPLVWDDNGVKHTYTVVPDLMAEINSDDCVNDNVLQADPKAAIIKNSNSIKIWKMRDKTHIKSLQSGTIPKNLKGNFSSVYRDQSGRTVVLLGKLIVKFEKKMDMIQIENLLKEYNIAIIRRLSPDNVFLVSSSSGTDSIKNAALLKTHKGVVSATPEVWTELQRK